MSRKQLKVIAWTLWLIAFVCALVAFSHIYNPNYPRWVNYEGGGRGRSRYVSPSETGYRYSPGPDNGAGWVIGMIACIGAGMFVNIATKRMSEKEK
ncbi:MAG: hypothetical protein WC683_03825 [bacterium]